ncbi:MAG TPA: hypothetical protein PL193_07680 [Xanthobacteraceae bacterium]|nr:hypothetical protein [Xanthobacteraceae bacterium]
MKSADPEFDHLPCREQLAREWNAKQAARAAKRTCWTVAAIALFFLSIWFGFHA